MKIYFVCTGNACRSPLAEAILRKKLQDRQIEVDVASAGTLDWGANPRDELYVSLGAEKGYTLEGLSRYIGDKNVNKELDEADLILVFEREHRDKLTRFLKYERWERIRLFMDYCFGEKVELDDPSVGTEADYRFAFAKIEEGCEMMADRLMNR